MLLKFQVCLYVFVCICLLKLISFRSLIVADRSLTRCLYSFSDLLVSFAETCSDSFAHIRLFSFILLRGFRSFACKSCSVRAMPLYLHPHSSSPASFVQICLFRFVARYIMLGGSFVGRSSPRSVGFSRGIQPWLSSAANLWRQVPEGLRRKLQLRQPHRPQAHRQSPPLQPRSGSLLGTSPNKQTNKTNKQTNQQTKKQTNKQTHIQFNLEDWYTQPFDPGFFRLPSMPPAAMFLGQPRTDLVPELRRASNAKPR